MSSQNLAGLTYLVFWCIIDWWGGIVKQLLELRTEAMVDTRIRIVIDNQHTVATALVVIRIADGAVAAAMAAMVDDVCCHAHDVGNWQARSALQ